MPQPRNLLTIATGKKLYVDMAVNLARSFRLWHHDSEMDFYLATDQPDLLPTDVKPYVKVIPVNPGELGEGFSTKLHLDKLAPEGQTLFIDSDCLIYRNIEDIFEKFAGHPVSVVGSYISGGEWFGDVAAVCRQFKIKRLPKFNGGIYYIEKGDKAKTIYQQARELETRYDEIGFVRLRNRPNDEVLMALAMELNHAEVIADDGSILGEFINFQSGVKSGLLAGVAELYNDPRSPAYQATWHLTVARPAIVHFLGHHNQVMPYLKEVKLLKYLFLDKLPKTIAQLLTFAHITLPFAAVSAIKKAGRPLYHLLFGNRKVKVSERVIAGD